MSGFEPNADVYQIVVCASISQFEHSFQRPPCAQAN